MTEFETTYLAHHGIKGQKWGIRNYQNPDGSLTSLGRKRYGIGTSRKTENPVKNVFKTVKKQAEEKKKRAAEEEKEKIKEHIRKNPKDLQKYSRVLSKSEINELIDDIQFDKKLKSIRDDEVRAGWKKVSDLSNNIGTIANFLNNGKNLYNGTADVYNTLIEAGVIKGKTKMIKVGEIPKEDRRAFEKLIRTGSDEEIAKAFDKLTSNEQREVLNRKKNAAEFKKILGGEDASNIKASVADDFPPMIIDMIKEGRESDAFALMRAMGIIN